LCFDLENRPLAYWYDGETTSQITAFGFKWADEKKVHVALLRPDGTYAYEDKVIGAEKAHNLFRLTLEQAALVYGHNIRRHDLPMFQAWLLRLGLPPLPRLLTSDTYKDYPRRAGLSVSLENLAAMYGLPGKKFSMSQSDWEDANRLTDSGLELARKRVASDVILQERLRKKLLELGLLGAPRMWPGSGG
jgi:hypothetical protein